MTSNSLQNLTFSLNILIVDNEQAIVDILSTGLNNKGHNCFKALNAKDGLLIAEKEKIHFSLLDISLPDRNGIDLCADIKRVSPGTINVLMTGCYPEIKSAVKGLKLSAYDYLVKPFRIEKVLAIIERAMKDLRLVGEKHYNKKKIRDLRDENEGLKQFIHDVEKYDARQRIQSQNTIRLINVDKERVTQSYSKHKSIPRLNKRKVIKVNN